MKGTDSEEVATRRALLRSVINAPPYLGSIQAFADKVGKPYRQVYDMLKGTKAFGDKVARDMERGAGLPKYHFEGLSTWPFAIDRAQFEGLTKEQLAKIEGAMTYVLGQIRESEGGDRKSA